MDDTNLQAYNFEPEYTEEELHELDNRQMDSLCSGIDTHDFCFCDNCVVLDNKDENVCCNGSELVVGNLEEIDCICDHHNFETLILNEAVLEVAYIQIMAYKGDRGRLPDHLNNVQYRLTAYRQFVCWMLRGEKLGKFNRVVLPSCVVNKIREQFPSPEYTGFKTAVQSLRDMFQ